MITYKDEATQSIVYLDGKIVGTIRQERMFISGWRYYPKGQKMGGQGFGTRQEVKNSLEEE